MDYQFYFTIVCGILVGMIFVIVAVYKTICNYRNHYPRFNEQEEKRLSEVLSSVQNSKYKVRDIK